MSKKVKFILFLCLYSIVTILITWLVSQNGMYPSGSDTMSHLYKADVLYKNIKQGNFYPLYDSMWYNGVEFLRYWAPLPVYFIAFCQALAFGNVLTGYLILIGCIFFFGACVWLYLGYYYNRLCFGGVLGILWFFMPNNLMAMFIEGNLPRSLCMVFLPLFLHFIHSYLLEDKWGNLPKMIVCFFLMALFHMGYASMIALAVVIFLCIYTILYRKTCNMRKAIHVIFCMILPFFCIGIWAYAFLQGGMINIYNSSIMKEFFQSILLTLNPFYRIESGNEGFYFGLAAFLIAVFGVFFGRRKTFPGFFTGVILCFCTTLTMYSILVLLPGSQYLWMLRFISIALCMILYSLLLWDTLRKSILFIACAILVVDVVPSLNPVYGDRSGISAEERLADMAKDTLITKAKEITKQRLALLDGSTLGSTGAFLISDFQKSVPATFGAGWQSANTAHNIVQLNTAIDNGSYLYLFDRCLELGNDTVLIKISQMQMEQGDIDVANQAAKKVGYTLVEQNEEYLLYHMDIEGTFGVVSQYRAIGIGTYASEMALQFPAIEETISNNLNDYTYEQLAQYDFIYLAGFTYTDRESVEDMLLRLSEDGVRIVIAADGIPSEEHTGTQSFLGINTQSITFSNGYPELETIDGTLDCDLFPKGHTDWRTVYINGLDECWGYFDDTGEKIEFYGTVYNENIVIIGLNLTYHYALTGDEGVGQLLAHAMNLSSDEIPKRTVVPLDVAIDKNSITIESDYDDVNTTLAFHDIFSSDQNLYNKNYLTYVDKGKTVIQMKYPYLWQGLFTSLIGCLLTGIFLHWTKKERYKMEKEKLEEISP